MKNVIDRVSKETFELTERFMRAGLKDVEGDFRTSVAHSGRGDMYVEVRHPDDTIAVAMAHLYAQKYKSWGKINMFTSSSSFVPAIYRIGEEQIHVFCAVDPERAKGFLREINRELARLKETS